MQTYKYFYPILFSCGKMYLTLFEGRENDDRRRDDFRHLLATIPHLLHRHISYAGIN